MTIDHELLLTADVEIVAAEGGKLPRVSILAYSGDVMTVPGFGPLVLDLSGMVLANEIQLLANHANNIDSIVGQGTPEVRSGQLFVEGTANTATPAAQQVIALAKSGHKFQASIGATPQALFNQPPNILLPCHSSKIHFPPRCIHKIW